MDTQQQQQQQQDIIHTSASHFRDANNRTLLLRGVNLSGASKHPKQYPSHLLSGFWESAIQDGLNGVKRITFVGRPLDLESGDGKDADVHLARLRAWGFNVLRYPISWEALEHEGPGKYDYEFIDYTIRVLLKCRDHGFKVFIDPHQDVWSRYSGGSGAPYWTFRACGLEPRHFTTTQGSLIHAEWPPESGDPGPAVPLSTEDMDDNASGSEEPKPDEKKKKPQDFPAMIWSTNYNRAVCQVMFTLFFAGKDFAPLCKINDQNIQEYLQSHYIEAYGILADALSRAHHTLLASGLPGLLDTCILGWDTMNEPSPGLIGTPDITKMGSVVTNSLNMGTRPSPIQGMRMGMGQREVMERWEFGSLGPRCCGRSVVDPRGVCMWMRGCSHVDRVDHAAADVHDDGGECDCEETRDGVNRRYGWRRSLSWKLGICVFALHGVWDVRTGEVLKPDYFSRFPIQSTSLSPSSSISGSTSGSGSGSTSMNRIESGQDYHHVEFVNDYWRGWFWKFVRRVKRSHPRAIFFVQPPVFVQPPSLGEGVGVGAGSGAVSRSLPTDMQEVEVDIGEGEGGDTQPISLEGRLCYSPHYYDGLTLITRHWHIYNADALGLLRHKYPSTPPGLAKLLAMRIGEGAIRRCLREQLALLKSDVGILGDFPVMVGEIGVPFDMDEGRSYGFERGGRGAVASSSSMTRRGCCACGWTRFPFRFLGRMLGRVGIGKSASSSSSSSSSTISKRSRTSSAGSKNKNRNKNKKYKGDYRSQQKALDASLNACDGTNVLNYTVWNYCPDNGHVWGDGWNVEDLSIWSWDDLRVNDSQSHSFRGDPSSTSTSLSASSSFYGSSSAFCGAPFSKPDTMESSASLDKVYGAERRQRPYGGYGGYGGYAYPPTGSLQTRGTDSSAMLMKDSAPMARNKSLLSLSTLSLAPTLLTPGSGSGPVSAGGMGLSSPSSLLPSSSRLNLIPEGRGEVGIDITSPSEDARTPIAMIPGSVPTIAGGVRSIPYPSPANALSFLTDGARGVRAFCRPWPVATIGTPVLIDFDIRKAEFKLVVRVSPLDTLPSNGGVVESNRGEGDGEKGAQLATEIYVPMVHFASPELVKRATISAADGGSCILIPNDEKDMDGGTDPDVERGVGGVRDDAEVGSIDSASIRSADRAPEEGLSTTLRSSDSSSGVSTRTLSSPPPSFIPPSALDITVDVSVGRYEVEGQYLRWYYPLPSAGEEPMEYTIVIRRSKGPIPGFMGSNMRSGLSDRLTFLEKVEQVADGCVIM